MIIHIGDNISLDGKDILIILDKKSVSDSNDNKNLIDNLIKSGNLVNKVDDIKSYIIVNEKNKRYSRNCKDLLKLYVSNISSNSLFNRYKGLDRRETND
ncbi:hypothetical protein [Tissierella sp. Yu-01]|uniref:hypothetical protein n=1 Tax=Tissierella sp. Yu-01 TaxID=3035694 RepID=UPI00240DCFD7|nr:hypothetical protein [Tissierella sp. Yu-01]WFA08322.1 hypothetical protein P3962_11350 [Tissierella sp. Yu-01]